MNTDGEQRPISMQIFGGDVESMVNAAKYIDLYSDADIIDINMGCPVPKVAVRAQAGSALLKNPEKIYDIVLNAQKTALSILEKGLPCAEADKAARGIIEDAGYGEYFGHGTGHGVGVEIHESPNLSPRSNQKLQKGNIVTIEPGIYIPEKFGVRIEDMAYITADGCRNLTNAPKELIIL